MKIAPTLRWHIQDPFASDAQAFREAVPQMVRELRALLAAAHALHRLLRTGNYRMPYKVWSATVGADARLERVSGGRVVGVPHEQVKARLLRPSVVEGKHKLRQTPRRGSRSREGTR